MITFSRPNQWCENRNHAGFRKSFGVRHDCSDGLPFDGNSTISAVLDAEFCKQQTQEMVHLRDRRDCGFTSTASETLFDGDTRRQTGNTIDIRSFELGGELARVR